MDRKEKAINKSAGFVDPDLQTDEHDRIMIWLHKNIDDVLSEYGAEKQTVKWEHPIIKGSGQYKSIIGYVDLAVLANKNCDGEKHQTIFYFEVKSHIKNVGELIRQIRQYQAFSGSDIKFIAVSPDDRFVDILNDQGIGFTKAPEKEAYISPEMVSILRRI